MELLNGNAAPVRDDLLVSRPRSGAIRRYGETVPANIEDPIAASAWQYQVDPNVYKTLERRS